VVLEGCWGGGSGARGGGGRRGGWLSREVMGWCGEGVVEVGRGVVGPGS
jgi:hypothetical protein